MTFVIFAVDEVPVFECRRKEVY